MTSLRVLMPSNPNTQSLTNTTTTSDQSSAPKEVILRRPGVPVTDIQTDWMCKRISHFKVSREVSLVGVGLYNNSHPNYYYGHSPDTYGGDHPINVEISIVEFKTGKVLYKAMSTLPAPTTKLPSLQKAVFKVPVQLKPGRLYEAMAYYDEFVPMYLKTDPFQNVQNAGTVGTTDGITDLTVAFKQMLPKGRYQTDGYPSEIPELIFA